MCREPNCDLTGWPELSNNCITHYRDIVLAEQWRRYCEAEHQWILARDKLFWVEVATRQRAAPVRSAGPANQANLRTMRGHRRLNDDLGDLD